MPDDVGLRCSICAIDWPDDPENFKRCPVCEEKTSRVRFLSPLPMAEALSIKRHADFERYYERTRGASSDAAPEGARSG